MIIRKTALLVTSGLFGGLWINAANAAPLDAASINASTIDNGAAPMAQVTSVSQLSDVQPTDWAFQALQSLVERYGCIAGYPDKTYRGNRALTRYEFAAGLNACLDRVNELIAAATADLVKKEDLATLQKLQEEFAAELATLRGRVDALEARTRTLEQQQFSTTTKLRGEAIFAVSNLFGDQFDGFGDRFTNQTVFNNRVRLELQTSFTGQDLLRTRLSASNVQPFTVSTDAIAPFVADRGTAEGTLANGVGRNTNNGVQVDRLDYTFPVGERLKVYVAGTGGRTSYIVPSTVNPFFEDFDGGNGSLSAFSQQSPIYRIGGGAGVGVSYAFDPAQKVVLSAGYLASNASDPNAKRGLFNGDYTAIAQLTVTPTPAVQLGLTYVNAYHTAGNSIFNLGLGNNDFFVGSLPANGLHTALSTTGVGVGAVTNSFGAQASFKVSPKLVINAFGGYTDLTLTGGNGNGQIWYYGLGIALPDLFKPGNLGGIMVGVEPYLGNVNLQGNLSTALGAPGGARLSDLNLTNATSLHVEAFYKYQVTPNISITPGVVWITNPDQGSNSGGPYVIGTIRTTFRF
jgi:Carbohydrate-selective porin, OprB family/S-layer homology domain